MYPDKIIFDMDLYQILIVVGFFFALLYLRLWGDRLGFSASLQNLCIVGAVLAMLGGAGSAILMQSLYHYLESGIFEQNGATFYGGLLGGAAVFLLIYFVGGTLLVKNGEANERFFELSEIAAGSIAVAHAFGRLGCLCAGCCHGAVTNAWYGVYNATLGQRTVPTQLFEALFLFFLFALLTRRIHRNKSGNLSVYLCAYALWRFLIEYIREDERGATVVSFLTPSQFVAVLLFLVGVGFWFFQRALKQRNAHADGGEP